jgi:uncharacterized membrane protein YfcA
MTPEQFLAAAAAGFAAGTVNAVVGAGSLITFPVLVLLGLPALDANMTSNIGVLAGNIASIGGYRSHLAKARDLLGWLAPAAVVGGLAGALLLLVLPASAFSTIVPVLVGLGIVLVIVGPFVSARVGKAGGWAAPAAVVALAVALVSVYGGYFGAAQGVLLVGVLGLITRLDLQAVNAVKIVATTLVNLVSTIIFMSFGWAHLHWFYVLAVGIGATAGGIVGAHVGSRLPSVVLRGVIVVIGCIALVVLLRT